MSTHSKNSRVKRILSLDGGGIRGTLSAKILVEIEKALQTHYQDPLYRLGDFFDLVGGTSTGSILAAGIAKGLSTTDLLSLYELDGVNIFQKHWLAQIPGLRKLYNQYDPTNLEKKLLEVFQETTLGDSTLKCYLSITTKNATTGQTRFFDNNQESYLYSENSQVKLRDIVRASSAAPTFFPPHRFTIGQRAYEFIDGGVSLYNNPSFQLFLQAYEKDKLGWEVGADKLLLVSIGTGFAYENIPVGKAANYTALDWAPYLVTRLMDDANVGQNQILQLISYQPNRFARKTNKVVKEQTFPHVDAEKLKDKFLTYYRFNASFEESRLKALGLSPSPQQLKALKKMDCVDQINFLQQIGAEVAKEQFDIDRFEGFL
ncbi:patatin-like phospholipase family protein [Gloeothece verrucosa]|uniref:Patatin n=1 Tax=Gloeothece verrucosa (strain PCC 7822) TaxID=497965 RepID=E0ULD7_GLOV7|nr:patatin-like phospholipase family protein [Gloeothece verrucosa]ADN17767.1 Patatin [Gloeothece verrucosa PCC 7822]